MICGLFIVAKAEVQHIKHQLPTDYPERSPANHEAAFRIQEARDTVWDSVQPGQPVPPSAQGVLASVEGSELLGTTASRSYVKIERFRFTA